MKKIESYFNGLTKWHTFAGVLYGIIVILIAKFELLENEITLAYQGGKAVSRWVNVKSPVPVFIEYYTAWADANGKLILAEDVYNYDSKLFDALKQFLPQ